MSLVTVNGYSVFRGNITLPLVGVWAADVDIDAGAELKGAASIEMPEGEPLVGTFVSAKLERGFVRARILAGGAGMSKLATPKHYTAPKLRTVLTDLMATAGEKVSSKVSADVLNASMLAWTTMRMPIGVQVAALVGSVRPTHSWRMLADGTLWIGAETWANSRITDYRELDRRAAEGVLELGLATPSLLPGTTLGEDHIGPVEYVIEQKGVRATAWLA